MRKTMTALCFLMITASASWAQSMVWDRLFQDEGAPGAQAQNPSAVAPGDAPVGTFAGGPLETDAAVALDAATQGRLDVTLARGSATEMMAALKDMGFAVVGVHPAPAFWPEGMRSPFRVAITTTDNAPLALILPSGVGSKGWLFDVVEGPPAPFLLVHVGALPPNQRPLQTNIAQLAIDVADPGACAGLGPEVEEEAWFAACLDPIQANRNEGLSVLSGYGFGWSLGPDGQPQLAVGPGVNASFPPPGLGDDGTGVSP